MIIVKRGEDEKRFKALGDWILIYGRRKTGKSFFVEKFTEWDEFFYVKRDRTIFSKREGKTISYETLLSLIKRMLEGRKRVVIDEFHRLPPDFLDFLHAFGRRGKLTLISSTLWITKKLLIERSPILGLFSEFPFGLIDERDILKFCLKLLKDEKEAVEMSIYAREPWLIHFFKKKMKAREFISNAILGSKLAIPGLIGEIFLEEERELSRVYEGILRCISNGKCKASEIANYLFSNKLLKKESPAMVQQYLVNLSRIGLIENVPLIGARGSIYKHISPVFEFYFFLEEKYNFSERELNAKFIGEVLNQFLPRQVEDFFRNLLAKIYGLNKAIFIGRDFDIDIALQKFKKPQIFGEVKWKTFVEKEEIRRTEERLGKLKGEKTLIVPSRDVLEFEPKILKVLTPSDISKLIPV